VAVEEGRLPLLSAIAVLWAARPDHLPRANKGTDASSSLGSAKLELITSSGTTRSCHPAGGQLPGLTDLLAL
jgi:hypothetical protein